jgi:hypothetical protein
LVPLYTNIYEKGLRGNEALSDNLDQKDVRLKYDGACPFHTQQLGGQGTFLPEF